MTGDRCLEPEATRLSAAAPPWPSLTPQMVAEAILTISRGEGPAGPAIAITGKSGLEAMG